MKETKPRLCLTVQFEEDNSRSLHACIKTIVSVDYWRDGASTSDGRDTSQWCGIGSCAEDSIRGYEDLQFTNYTFEDHNGEGFQASYGYHKYRTGLHEAERMVRTLKAIYRAADKLKAIEGYPKTFGQEVNRLARIVGAAVVRIEKTKLASGRTGERWTEVGIGDAVFHVDHRVSDWLRERRESRQVVA